MNIHGDKTLENELLNASNVQTANQVIEAEVEDNETNEEDKKESLYNIADMYDKYDKYDKEVIDDKYVKEIITPGTIRNHFIASRMPFAITIEDMFLFTHAGINDNGFQELQGTFVKTGKMGVFDFV